MYFVVLLEGKVVGGGGIVFFVGYMDLCELKKLFLFFISCGYGVGWVFSEYCLNFVK